MKKHILLAATLLLSVTWPSFSQEVSPEKGEWEINVGVCYGIADRLPFRNAELSNNRYRYSYTVDDHTVSVYYSGATLLPAFSLSAGYVFPNHECGVFLNVFLNYAYETLNGGPSPLYEKEAIWHIIPEFRMYYKTWPKVRLYGSVGTGLRLRHYSETFRDDTLHDFKCGFTGFFSPIAVSVGEKCFFSFELGGGLAWSILKFNVGYRF